MSFDSTTRNKLAKFVAEARSLLVGEFGEQLQEIYGIRINGTVLPLENLAHLTDAERAKASLLREQIDHILSGMPGTARKKEAEAVDRIIREQAFTLFNRFCALRMAEERDLVQECVGAGYQSKGFRVFETVAGTGIGNIYDRYKTYLFSLFDEISTELGVLFDRFSPMGLLFPRENALKTLLALLHDSELKRLWSEDETIGWIYQYWNTKEERQMMRKASAAPRNSRELAVRNQFFTPRYVVEFLTDNTLGRIWYEMRKGDTVLKEECRYLVRRPNEIFLDSGEKAPADQESEADLSQEELLKKPVHIEHRPKKDPRDLRILDPACGSGHFLLYCFDLLERIYEEAFEDTESPESEATGRTLWEDFETIEGLHQALPKLIMKHNLHGIDIDPRAVQISALALWLRAQKSWKKLGIRAAERPQVAKSNIVTAEPMPGEENTRSEFTAGLKPRVLGQLVDVVFEKMKLAGEAGSLLKIEDEIKDAVTEARKHWLEGPKPEQQQLFLDMAESRPEQQEMHFDFKGVTDERFWEQTEHRILDALEEYSEWAENGHAISRRLFAEDAVRGFAFIELCRKRYDVVLMNPPFGSTCRNTENYIIDNYPLSKVDLFAAFVDRSKDLLTSTGSSGQITNRTAFFITHLEQWRIAHFCRDRYPALVADFGSGVLDAMVETAAYVIAKGDSAHAMCFDLRSNNDHEPCLLKFCTTSEWNRIHPRVINKKIILSLPKATLAYWLSEDLLRLYGKRKECEPELLEARMGLRTLDDFRFLRAWWEIPGNPTGWIPHSKGGAFSRYYSDIHLRIKWHEGGAELKQLAVQKYNSVSRTVQAQGYYGKCGLTYSQRTTNRLSIRPMVPGGNFSAKGPLIITTRTPFIQWSCYLLGLLNSNIVENLISIGISAADSAARSYDVGLFQRMPFVEPDTKKLAAIAELSKEAFLAARQSFSYDEVDYAFRPDINARLRAKASEYARKLSRIKREIDDAIIESYGLPTDKWDSLEEALPPEPTYDIICSDREQIIDNFQFMIGILFGRWDIRIGLDPSLLPKLPEPFDPLPVCPPGMLVGPEGRPAEAGRIVTEQWLRSRLDANTLPTEGLVEKRKIQDSKYPLRISWDGILVDDPGFNSGNPHREDIVRRIREVLDLLWKDKTHEIEQEACDILGVKDLRDYFRKPTGFFQEHLKRYSKSRRQAPIYWPLSTESGSYTLWVYYHRLDDQILFKCVRIVELRIKEVGDDIEQLHREMGESGNKSLRGNLEKLLEFHQELFGFKDELLRVAKFYKPDLNDGVIINAAPLWKLFRLKKWQKSCKDCWAKLEAGEYDWSHMAMNLHPDQVREKCKNDKSLAIAHGLEELYVETETPKKKGKRKTRKTKDAL